MGNKNMHNQLRHVGNFPSIFIQIATKVNSLIFPLEMEKLRKVE